MNGRAVAEMGVASGDGVLSKCSGSGFIDDKLPKPRRIRRLSVVIRVSRPVGLQATSTSPHSGREERSPGWGAFVCSSPLALPQRCDVHLPMAQIADQAVSELNGNDGLPKLVIVS